MRKVLSVLIALLIAASVIPAAAEEPAEPAEENSSKFEQVLLKKGSLIVKEFIDCGYFEKDEYIDYGTSSELFGFTDTLKFKEKDFAEKWVFEKA